MTDGQKLKSLTTKRTNLELQVINLFTTMIENKTPITIIHHNGNTWKDYNGIIKSYDSDLHSFSFMANNGIHLTSNVDNIKN